MVAQTSEEICKLFKLLMREGDINALLTLYDDDAVFMNSLGELKRGHGELKLVILTPLIVAGDR